MTDVMNLGERLRKMRADKQAAVAAAEQARIRAAYEKSERERIEIRNFWYEYVAYVQDQIDRGKEPAPKRVPEVFVQLGQTLDNRLHSHHDIWTETQTGAGRLGLDVRLTYAHDGMGMESWYEMQVEPQS